MDQVTFVNGCRKKNGSQMKRMIWKIKYGMASGIALVTGAEGMDLVIIPLYKGKSKGH